MAYIGTEPKDVRSFGRAKFDYTATQGQTAFTGADDDGKTLGFTDGQMEVFVNGILMDESDFSTSNGNTVTLASAANLNDIISIVAMQTDIPNSDYVPATGGTFSGSIGLSGAAGSDAVIKKNSASGRDELQIYSGGDAYESGSRGAGIHLYGNSDSEHDGNFAVLTGPNDNGNARIIASGREDKTHVTIGNSMWDYVDDGNDHALLNLKSPSSQPALLIEGASGTEGDIVIPHDEALQVGHWTKSTSTFTERMKIDTSGRVTMPYQPSFKAHGTSNQYLDSTPIEFQTTTGRGGHNIGNHYSTSTDRFTAPVSGRYFFYVHVGIIRIQATTAACYPVLRINGSSIIYSYVKMTGSMPDYVPAHLSAVVDLSASDYVDVTFVGGSNSQYYNGPGELSFQGYLLG